MEEVSTWDPRGSGASECAPSGRDTPSGHDFGADAMGFELQKRLNESPVRGALLKCVEVAVHRAEVHDAAIDHRGRHDRPDGDESGGVHVHVLEGAEDGGERLRVATGFAVPLVERI